MTTLTKLPSSPLRRRKATFRIQADRRATLRDLYTSGLVSIFRRDSVLRLWEPLRETPRATLD